MDERASRALQRGGGGFNLEMRNALSDSISDAAAALLSPCARSRTTSRSPLFGANARMCLHIEDLPAFAADTTHS